MGAGDVGAGDPAGALDDARVDEEPDAGLRLLPQRLGTDVALHQRRVLGELGLVHGLDLDRLELALEALLVDVAVAGHADREGFAGAVGVLEHDQHVLERVAGRPGTVVARVGLVEVGDEGVDGRGVGGVLGVRGGRVVVRHRRRGGHGDGLDVGGVVAERAADVGVLADGGLGEELLARRAAHRAGGRLDDDVLEAEPVEDPDVGVAVLLVGLLEPGVVDVEGVGVLHDELAAAQQPGAGTRLVAVLGLDLVDRERQVLVGRVEVLHHEGEHLLVRGTEQVVGALAVLEPEDVGAVVRPASARLVGLLGQQRRERQLLGADLVHLVADDVLDPAEDAEPQRQPRVDAGCGTADVAGADEQLVARHLGVVGVVAQGAHEQGRHAEDAASHGRNDRGGPVAAANQIAEWAEATPTAPTASPR